MESSIREKQPATIKVEIEKGPAGFGINIVGGKDSHHIPNDSGIFITKISPGTAAYDSQELGEGDRILSIDAVSLVDVTHDQAVDAFRNCSGKVKLLVETSSKPRSGRRDSARSRSSMAAVPSSSSSFSPIRPKIRRASAGPQSQAPCSITATATANSARAANDQPLTTASAQSVSSEQESVHRRRVPAVEESRTSLSAADDDDGLGLGLGASGSKRKYFLARDIFYTAVGLATVAGVALFAYRRFSRSS